MSRSKKSSPVPTLRPARGLTPFAILGLAILLGGAALAVGTRGEGTTRRVEGLSPLVRAKVAFVDRDYAAAEAILREHFPIASDLDATVLLGRVNLERGKYAEARDLFAAALKTSPDNLEATRGLARAYKGLGQVQLAVLHWTKASALAKGEYQVWRELGLALRESGDTLAALSAVQQSLSLNPEQTDLSHLLTEVAVAPRSMSPMAAPTRASAFDPLNPRSIDPNSVMPKAQVPDPSRFFPKPGDPHR